MASFQGVEEVPGLYGSFTKVDEKVIQQIWAEQDFNRFGTSY